MVDKFKKLLEEIETTKGKVVLFAITKMDELTDKWSIILCAQWADNDKQQEAFDFVFGLLLKYFGEEERNSIARIGIYHKNEHLIESLLQYKKDSIIENEKINGNIVHLGYILESNANV